VANTFHAVLLNRWRIHGADENTTMHVLIIEDERNSTSSLFGYLETKGHVVDTLCSDISRRLMALVVQYDAIILDVSSPDGLRLCRQLRESGCKATPILMISAADTLDDKIACMEAGADDYLVKHVTMSEIESRLRVLFRMNSRARANINFGLCCE
jgi:DNA-binding response OmpR family regulator